MSVRVLVGTSGYSYPEWKGNFYPKKIAAKDMLRWYAERFQTVEINNTFYRMPTEGLLGDGRSRCPSTSRSCSRRRAASRTTSGSRTAAS